MIVRVPPFAVGPGRQAVKAKEKSTNTGSSFRIFVPIRALSNDDRADASVDSGRGVTAAIAARILIRIKKKATKQTLHDRGFEQRFFGEACEVS